MKNIINKDRKFIIVTLAGGLGNQMLQYVLFWYLSAKGNNCRLYLKPNEMNDHHGFNLDQLFPSVRYIKSSNYYNSLLRIDQVLIRFASISRKLLKADLISWIRNILPVRVINFPAWNNYGKIVSSQASLAELFIFPPLKEENNILLSKKIQETNSVSIHIRRGDYVDNPKWRSILGDICDLSYYKKAIEIMKSKTLNPQFYIFSDDVAWAKSNLDLPNAMHIDWNTGDKSFRDMQLMALCKHNIIANSTFSLMGAYLNVNKDKIVIAPSKWRNYPNDNTGDKFLISDWQVVDTHFPHCSLILSNKADRAIIKNILKQNYSDLEVLVQEAKIDRTKDYRLKSMHSAIAKGKHKITVTQKDYHLFKNRSYLYSKLLETYSS